MIRVMIVEDEPPTLRSLTRMIESSNHHFKVVATAKNGEEAIDLLDRVSVDVVFTDIRMPKINGIDLIEFIEKNYGHIIKVVISGFQEFEYAKSAIKYSVLDYLLKPIIKSNLKPLLNKITKLIKEKEKESKSKKLYSMIHSNINSPCKVKLAWNKKYYAIGIICVGPFPVIPTEKRLLLSDFWHKKNPKEIILENLKSDEELLMIDGNSEAEKVIIFGYNNTQRKNIFSLLYKRLIDNSEQFITLSVCSKISNMNNVFQYYKLVRSKLFQLVSFDYSQLIHIEENKQHLITIEQVLGEPLKKIVENIVVDIMRQRWMDVNKKLKQYFKKFHDSKLPQFRLESFLMLIVNNVNEHIQNNSCLINDLDLSVLYAITNSNNYYELRRNLMNVFQGLELEKDTQKIPPVVFKVEDYLKKHYADEITNQTLYKQFGYVPQYIAKLFQSYKGMSPVQFLTKIRIEKAKEIMRTHPNLLVKEIANRVGYNDPLYFSRVFQKDTGISPTEYKDLTYI